MLLPIFLRLTPDPPTATDQAIDGNNPVPE